MQAKDLTKQKALDSDSKAMNKKQFLLYKKLFGQINHHQLLINAFYTKFLPIYQTLLIVKSN